MSNVVSSAIFCARNVEKAENQDKVGRWGVAVGQAKKVFDYVQTIDNKLGEKAREANSLFKDVAKEEKILGNVGKAVKFASDHVNPLICVSTGIDVLRSDDKEYAAVTGATALGAMFGTEHLMQKHFKDVIKIKGIDSITKNIVEYAAKEKHAKMLPSIIQGTIFVIGSCTGYTAGEKFGKLLMGREEYKKQPSSKS